MNRRINSDSQRVSVLPDVSAAFNTVDHDNLSQRLCDTVGLTGQVLDWLPSKSKGKN